MIRNPILPGFHPDPSIARAGEDYYIATSTFEWFPGVCIHHSRDLIHWQQIAHPLTRLSQLDLRGVSDSSGVWAPCLSYDKGTFYLIYTVVRARNSCMIDPHNYLVTASAIEGPWSEPVYLNSSGFDPSLFHDVNGRKWMVNMWWDHRREKNRFGGILLQEYSEKEQCLVGPVKNIFKGTELGVTEAPHLYRRGEWYYLMCAEGGTSYGHAVTMARSKKLEGPYAVDPQNPMLTTREDEQCPLQRAGHASLVETTSGETYIVHLASRPLPGTQNCTLGRETCLQRCEWNAEGWLRLASVGNTPQIEVRPPALPAYPLASVALVDDFESGSLPVHWQTLRVPADESWLSLIDRPGWLRLTGRESLVSAHEQSMIARRWQAFEFAAKTVVDFTPQNPQQLAGLICYYGCSKLHYAALTWHEEHGRCLTLITSDREGMREVGEYVPVCGAGLIELKVEVNYERLQFYWRELEGDWHALHPEFDAKVLSDEYPGDGEHTGAFVGLCAQDLSGQKAPAYFDYFKVENNSY